MHSSVLKGLAELISGGNIMHSCGRPRVLGYMCLPFIVISGETTNMPLGAWGYLLPKTLARQPLF